MADDVQTLKDQIQKLKTDYNLLHKHLVEVELKYQEKLDKVYNESSGNEFMIKQFNFISKLFNNDKYSDMIILLEGGLHLKAHKFILSAQSDYWDSLDSQTLDLTGLSYDVGYAMIKWMYTNQLVSTEEKFKELYDAAVEYRLETLQVQCSEAEDMFVDTEKKEIPQESVEVEDLAIIPEMEVMEVESGAVNFEVEEDIESKPESVKNQENLFKCSECEKLYNSLSLLKKHMKYHNKIHQCTQCPKSFAKPYELKRHIKTSHEKIRDFKCPICDMLFTFKGNLNQHVQRHTEVGRFVCSHCHRSFNSKGNLDVHVRIHTGVKPYVCEFCGLGFSQLINKQNHARIHTGERPHACTYCPKTFRCPGDLRKHIRCHTKERPYKCLHCGKCYTQSQHLSKHLNTHAAEILNT